MQGVKILATCRKSNLERLGGVCGVGKWKHREFLFESSFWTLRVNKSLSHRRRKIKNCSLSWQREGTNLSFLLENQVSFVNKTDFNTLTREHLELNMYILTCNFIDFSHERLSCRLW